MEIKTKSLINTLPKKFMPVAKYIDMHESEGALAHVRFAQDTIVNWVPKVVFARGMADFADMSFLEITENLLVYFGPALLGQGLFRKIYSKKLNPQLKEAVAVPAKQLLKEKNVNNKVLMPIKAAIAVSALAIPLAEYSLNYVKNLFTIKLFKQADFNNIANLNKVKTEDAEKQEKVKKSAKKHLKLAAGIFAGCLGLSALLATRGKNSKTLQSLSETILAPGNKIFKPKSNTPEAIAKAEEKAAKFNEFFSIDFRLDESKDKFGNVTKKLALSRGQLMSCVLIGFLGYMGAAKDRGKQNMLEVLFRYPVVTFYVISGADLFIAGFKKILNKKGKCKELLDEEKLNNKMPKLDDLHKLAEKLAAKNRTSIETEFKKLFKQKATIIGIPTLFSLVVMGFFVAGVSISVA